MNILVDASLPDYKFYFPASFKFLSYRNLEELKALLPEQQILLCRANIKIDEKLLKDAHKLKYIATASSGTDHIDNALFKARKIKIISARGCNAIAVADYVLSLLAYLQKYKKLILKKIGIVGVGAVGTEVAKRLNNLGLLTVLYDPPKSLRTPSFISAALDDLLACDVISIHANLHNNFLYPSYNLFNKSLFAKLKKGMVIINAARGGIVNEEELLQFSENLLYCTDVFCHEPEINSRIVECSAICTPHIAGHSIEGKNNAVLIVIDQLMNLLNMRSVNRKFDYITKQGNSFTPVLPQLKLLKKILYGEGAKTLYSQQLDCWLGAKEQNEGLYMKYITEGEQIYNNDETLNTQSTSIGIEWTQEVLQLYNPVYESNKLKSANNLAVTFLKLRKQHTYRHDFPYYLTIKDLSIGSNFVLSDAPALIL